MIDGGGTLDLTLAVSLIEIGTRSLDNAGRPQYQNFGWDMDNTCTGEGQGPSCIEPSGEPPSHYQDGVDGIDNAFGLSWWNRSLSDVGTPDAKAVEGLLRIREYNGMPDDDQVEVSSYYALGLSARDNGQSGAVWPPLWDGEDRWNILPDSLESPEGGAPSLDRAKYVDGNAYVRDGILVARFVDGLSLSYLSTLPNHLWHAHRGVLAGPLWKGADGTWELQAMVGWRIALSLVAQATALIELNAANTALCMFPSSLQAALRSACSYADIAYDDDSPTAKCDAVSLGALLHMKPARLGDMAEPLQESLPCDVSMYSCDFGDD